MRSKGKQKKNPSNPKNHPLNININFNINPKNILQHELPLEQKHNEKIHPEHAQMTAKIKQAKHRKVDYEEAEGGQTQRTIKKVNFGGQSEGELNKKELQKIKKKFLNKINNMDITLALPGDQKKHLQKDQEDPNQSSLMSAKMVQYDNNLVKKSNQSLQLNFNNISGKSKILTDNQPGKILQMEVFKKTKHGPKQTDRRFPIISFSKEEKINTHFKGYSTFTDNKYSPEKYRRKKTRMMHVENKKTKPKEQNLKEKLERFKLDIMKLALADDQSEILKTKISSEYYNNIRSREISKDVVDVHKMNEIQQHEKSEQIKKFQVNQPSKELTPQQESQSFKNLKDVYQNLTKKRNLDQGKECTENIVEYYTQLISQPQYVIDGPEDEESQESEQNRYQSLWQRENIDNNPLVQSKDQKKEIQLQQFVKFLQQKLTQSPNKQEVAKQLEILLEEYKKPRNGPSFQQKDQKKQCQESQENKLALSQEGFQIGNIDLEINKQLQSIPLLKDQLTDKYKMNGDQVFELEQWEENYKNQLLKIKGKMWKEYKTIKNIIENRITNPSNNRPVETRKIKKQQKIMKCLSEKLFLKKPEQQTSVESLEKLKEQRILLKMPKQKGFLIKQEHLMVEPSLSDENSDSRIDLEIVEGEANFIHTSSDLIPSKISDKEENILINGLVKVEMDQKDLQPSCHPTPTIASLHRLSEEDKEDIFEFIFLDICIELYQEAVENENQLQTEAQGEIINNSGSNRILNSIKSYIRQQNKKKKEKESRKIGFCTNVNAVKQTVQQICEFAISELHINNSILSNKQRVTKKLSTPLGPSESQILKSLRLNIFSNQPIDDYGDDVQEADLLVLEPDLFLYYENEIVKVQQLSFPRYYDDEGRDQLRISFLRNCTHIHQKAIFDCLNENLDYYRTYGIWGKPFIWKKTAMFQRPITTIDLSKALNNSGAQVVKCAAYVCGLMVHKEDSLIKDIASDSNYVRRLQDERIYKLLQNFVLEMDEKWFFHDDEQAEVLVELSHLVWTILIKEVLKDIQSLLK